MPVTGWILLFISILLGFILSASVYDYSEFLSSLIQCTVMFIPLLYYLGWDYKLIIRWPTRDEVKLAILMFLGYICYAMVMIIILETLGLTGSGGVVPEDYVTIETIISLIFSMMSEELIKFIPLMFFMRLFYKFSQKRKLSFIVSAIIVMAGFGLLHYTDGVTLYSVLLIQGLGSIFEVYGYYKTRNLLVPYLSHLLTDAFLMSIMLLQL
ncbi:MAG: hypothetical protein IJI98_05805 [Methanosphaera sp.]|nr:hypothetical protein [Methanosphaera sp.]